jgi:hypothetical protein
MTFDPYADHFRTAAPKAPFTPSVKSEPSSSSSSPHHFSFSYPVPSAPEHPYEAPQDAFRFSMTHAHPADAWPRPQHDPAHGASIDIDLGALAFADDYEDADELSDLPGSATSGPAAHATQSERIIRRRSSKGRSHFVVSVDFPSDFLVAACDQCRKSKCKCERAADGGACKSCIMLGTRESIFTHSVS